MLTCALLSQNKRVIDSLLQLAASAKEDSVKARYYNRVSALYYRANKTKEASEYARQGLELAQRSGNTFEEALAYNSLGSSELLLGKFEESLAFYMKSIAISEKTGEERNLASSYINIGVLYERQKNYVLALEYYLRSKTLKEKLHDERALAGVYSNIGNIYNYKSKYDSSRYYYGLSLVIRKKKNDVRGMAMVYNNLGKVSTQEGKYNDALENYLKAITYRKEAEDSLGLAVTLSNIAEVYIALKDGRNAEKYLAPAQAIFISFDDRVDLIMVYELLSQAYELEGQIQKALNMHKRYVDLKDSIYQQETNKNNADLMKKYESVKKDKEIIEQNTQLELGKADSAKKENQRNIFIIAALLLVIISVFVLRVYIQKRRSNIEISKKNTLLEEKNNEIVAQKNIIEEKNKDILDSINYAKRIQTALLPSEEVFNALFSDSFVLFQPRDIVSGDFFWCHQKDNYIFFTAADCTGHGVPGGFMSMLGMALLEEVINEKKIYEPADILDMLRLKIIHALKQKNEGGENKDGMDMILCRMDKVTGELVYAAANNPLWIVDHAGKFTEYRADKQPVGISTENVKQFNQQRVMLNKGDAIYAFTDGYADQFGGPKGKKFKYKPLLELMVSNHDKTMSAQKQILKARFEEWKGELEQVDDVCIIGIRI
jgi:serine phosphatase RsbU (regulator of sigma subunit)